MPARVLVFLQRSVAKVTPAKLAAELKQADLMTLAEVLELSAARGSRAPPPGPVSATGGPVLTGNLVQVAALGGLRHGEREVEPAGQIP